MAIDQSLFSGRKLRAKLTTLTHPHQFQIRSAKTAENRISEDPLFLFLAPQTLTIRIDQIDRSVSKRTDGIIDKVSSKCIHRSILFMMLADSYVKEK